MPYFYLVLSLQGVLLSWALVTVLRQMHTIKTLHLGDVRFLSTVAETLVWGQLEAMIRPFCPSCKCFNLILPFSQEILSRGSM